MVNAHSSLRRVIAYGLAVSVVVAGLSAGSASAATATKTRAPARCPVLVLSAMPLELDPILAKSHVDSNATYVHDGRGFWEGRVEGNRAIFALTGIGIVNATRSTEAAFAHFHCLSAVVFSGTSGGDYIGDVMAPARWTEDGKHFVSTSPSTLGVLRTALRRSIPLQQTTPSGDPFCTCYLTGFKSASTPVTVEHVPKVEVGGTGLSSDGFGGRAFPCAPAASDVFGCWPCPLTDSAAKQQGVQLTQTVPPFLELSFVLDYESASATPPGTYVDQDMETAAVFAVVARHHVPFIGFRAASDGGGDPLHLPGFPAEFFFYRQLAADNAASTALAFLAAWHSAHP